VLKLAALDDLVVDAAEASVTNVRDPTIYTPGG
jgi:hypothetical protein